MNINLNKQVEETINNINSATELLQTLKKCNENAVVACANQRLIDNENRLSYIIDLINLCGGPEKLSKLIHVDDLWGCYGELYLKYNLKNKYFSVRTKKGESYYLFQAKITATYVSRCNGGDYTFGYEEIINGFKTIDKIDDICFAGEALVNSLLINLSTEYKVLAKQIEKYQNDFQRFVGNSENVNRIIYDALILTNEIDDVSLENQGVAIWKNGKKYTILLRENK